MTAAVPERRLLTLAEAAEEVRYSPRTVRRWIDDGRLRAIQVGGRGASIRVDSRDLERLLQPTEEPAA